MQKWEYCHVLVMGKYEDPKGKQYRVYRFLPDGYEQRIHIFHGVDTLGFVGVMAELGFMGWEMVSGPLPHDREDLIAYFKRPIV